MVSAAAALAGVTRLTGGFVGIISNLIPFSFIVNNYDPTILCRSNRIHGERWSDFIQKLNQENIILNNESPC